MNARLHIWVNKSINNHTQRKRDLSLTAICQKFLSANERSRAIAGGGATFEEDDGDDKRRFNVEPEGGSKGSQAQGR